MKYTIRENPDGNFICEVFNPETKQGASFIIPGRAQASPVFGSFNVRLKTRFSDFTSIVTKKGETSNTRGLQEFARRPEAYGYLRAPLVDLMGLAKTERAGALAWQKSMGTPVFADGEAGASRRHAIAAAILSKMNVGDVMKLAVQRPSINAILVDAGEDFAAAFGFPSDLHARLVTSFTEHNLAEKLSGDAQFKIPPSYLNPFAEGVDQPRVLAAAKSAIKDKNNLLDEIDAVGATVRSAAEFFAVSAGVTADAAYSTLTAPATGA